MKLRRFFGNILIALGALNILNFWAPRPIPTIGFSAFIVGGLLCGLGFILRAERDATGKIQWGRLNSILAANSKVRKKVGETQADGTGPRDPMLAVRALRLASQRGGKLTVAQTAMELDVPIDSAEAALDECATKGSAFIDVDRGTGIAAYHFPEFETDSER